MEVLERRLMCARNAGQKNEAREEERRERQGFQCLGIGKGQIISLELGISAGPT